MEKFKSREYYEDFYDKHTIERCRWHVNHKVEITNDDIDKANMTPAQADQMRQTKAIWSDLVKEMSVWAIAAERYNKKDSTIDGWMRRDREHNDQIAKIEPPEHVRCRECLSTALRLVAKDEYWRRDMQHQMLFTYRCKKCDTNTAFFETGEQYQIEPTLCPKCGHDKQTFTRNEAEHILTITHTCSKCAHTWIEELDFTLKPEEPPDPIYLVDRKLYCYSDKVRSWAEQAMRLGPELKHLLEKEEENKETKRLKEQLAKIERLTIAQVHDKLEKAVIKDGYKDLQFGQPDMGKQVMVPINLMDHKDRSPDVSRNNLYKLVSKTLENTNWRLVGSNLSYRMGYLTGKLKGYETDEDLRILNESATKKSIGAE